ncbi:MAG TPA: hypothetical protein VLZ74_00260 [Methylocella sp.]|nr:hypothetical protein [Methylocella sp.]
MGDYYEFGEPAPPQGSRFNLWGILIRDWPYVVMLLLALFGVAYTNFARQSMTGYWIILAPIFGFICVVTRWRAIEGNQGALRLIGTQVFHWTAVVFAMYLVFVADVSEIMSDFASSLMVLIVLALGTFTAGIHIAAWRVCVVGIVLALGVPAIAWFEERTLLVLLLTLMLLAGIAVFFVLAHRRGSTKAAPF